MIQQSLARLLDGHDLSRADARDGDGRDHARRGDAGADRRLPRRAAAEGRDAPTRSPAAPRRCASTSCRCSPQRDDLVDTAGTGRRRRPDVQHLDRRRAGGGGRRLGGREARQPGGLVGVGLGGRARGARLPARPGAASGSRARSTSSASASSSPPPTTRRCATRRRCGASWRRARSSTSSAR